MHTVDFTLGINFLPYRCFKYGLHDKAEPAENTQDVNLTGSTYCWEARHAYSVLHCVMHTHPHIWASYHLHMNSQYAGNKQIHFSYYIHIGQKTYFTGIWFGLLFYIFCYPKGDFQTVFMHHTQAWSMTHSYRKMSPVWACHLNNLIWLPGHAACQLSRTHDK